MARYCRETCGGPITGSFINRPVHLLHLPSQAGDRASTLLHSGDTQVTTKTTVAPRGGCPRRCDHVSLGSLRYFLCCVARMITVQQCTRAPIEATSPPAGLPLMESCSDIVKKHQSMIAWKTMDIFPGRVLLVYIANLSAKLLLFTKIWSLRMRQKCQSTLCSLEGKSLILGDNRKRVLHKPSVYYDKNSARKC